MLEAAGPRGYLEGVEEGERENCSKSRDLRDEVVRDPGGQVTLAVHGM